MKLRRRLAASAEVVELAARGEQVGVLTRAPDASVRVIGPDLDEVRWRVPDGLRTETSLDATADGGWIVGSRTEKRLHLVRLDASLRPLRRVTFRSPLPGPPLRVVDSGARGPHCFRWRHRGAFASWAVVDDELRPASPRHRLRVLASVPGALLLLAAVVGLFAARAARRRGAPARAIDRGDRAACVAVPVGSGQVDLRSDDGDVWRLDLADLDLVGYDGVAPPDGPCVLVGAFPRGRTAPYRGGPVGLDGLALTLVRGDLETARALTRAVARRARLRALLAAWSAALAPFALVLFP